MFVLSGVIKLGGDEPPFSGQVSLVQSWCQVLSIDPDIQAILKARNKAVPIQLEALVAEWSRGAYTTDHGPVFQVAPSTRGLVDCYLASGNCTQDTTRGW